MKNEITLYNRTETGDIQVWHLIADAIKCTVMRKWGKLGGRMVETVETVTAKQGRTAASRLIMRVGNLVQDRIDKGWSTSIDRVRTTTTLKSTDMDFQSLPVSFAPQKPVSSPPLHNAALEKSIGRYLFIRKRDGQRHYVLHTIDGEIRIYSRRMEEKTAHLPRLARAFKKDIDLPRGSVVDGELIVDRNGADDFRATGSICRATARTAAANEKTLPVFFMPFDLLFLKKDPIWLQAYQSRRNALLDIFSDSDERFMLPETFDRFVPARAAVQKHGWEGLVIWDLKAPNALRMNGKHVRDGCYKWKPIQTGDFVATGWLPGNGRLSKMMGKLLISEFQNGKLVEIGRVGSGFDDETRAQIAAGAWKFPCVVELEYDKQEEDSRALRFPVFVRMHPDKTVEELR